MTVYRYEREDRGGPWVKLDGTMRDPPYYSFIKYKEFPFVFGFESEEQRRSYAELHKDELEGCVLKTYEVPREEIDFGEYNVMFPKRYLFLQKG